MRKIAIITPCILPVPNTLGGAVESLITKIINDNEIYNNFDIDLYTIASDNCNDYHFSSTNIVRIDQTYCSKYTDKFIDKLDRTLEAKKSFRTLDNKIIKAFSTG